MREPTYLNQVSFFRSPPNPTATGRIPIIDSNASLELDPFEDTADWDSADSELFDQELENWEGSFSSAHSEPTTPAFPSFLPPTGDPFDRYPDELQIAIQKLYDNAARWITTNDPDIQMALNRVIPYYHRIVQGKLYSQIEMEQLIALFGERAHATTDSTTDVVPLTLLENLILLIDSVNEAREKHIRFPPLRKPTDQALEPYSPILRQAIINLHDNLTQWLDVIQNGDEGPELLPGKKLHRYQLKRIIEYYLGLIDHKPNAIFDMATGTGKTLVYIAIVLGMLKGEKDYLTGCNVVITTPYIVLKRQVEKILNKIIPNELKKHIVVMVKAGIYNALNLEESSDNLSEENKKRIELISNASVIILDEVHCDVTEKRIKNINKFSGKTLLAFSGTITDNSSQENDVYTLFNCNRDEHHISPISVIDGIEVLGCLSPIRIGLIHLTMDETMQQDFYLRLLHMLLNGTTEENDRLLGLPTFIRVSEISAANEITQLLNQIYHKNTSNPFFRDAFQQYITNFKPIYLKRHQKYQAHSRKYKKYKPPWPVTNKNNESVRSFLETQGFGFTLAAAVHSNHRTQYNLTTIEQAQVGQYLYVVGVDMIGTGLDWPNLKVIINTCASSSSPTFSRQLLGRGTRQTPDKEVLIALDVVDPKKPTKPHSFLEATNQRNQVGIIKKWGKKHPRTELLHETEDTLPVTESNVKDLPAIQWNVTQNVTIKTVRRVHTSLTTALDDDIANDTVPTAIAGLTSSDYQRIRLQLQKTQALVEAFQRTLTTNQGTLNVTQVTYQEVLPPNPRRKRKRNAPSSQRDTLIPQDNNILPPEWKKLSDDIFRLNRQMGNLLDRCHFQTITEEAPDIVTSKKHQAYHLSNKDIAHATITSPFNRLQQLSHQIDLILKSKSETHEENPIPTETMDLTTPAANFSDQVVISNPIVITSFNPDAESNLSITPIDNAAEITYHATLDLTLRLQIECIQTKLDYLLQTPRVNLNQIKKLSQESLGYHIQLAGFYQVNNALPDAIWFYCKALLYFKQFDHIKDQPTFRIGIPKLLFSSLRGWKNLPRVVNQMKSEEILIAKLSNHPPTAQFYFWLAWKKAHEFPLSEESKELIYLYCRLAITITHCDTTPEQEQQFPPIMQAMIQSIKKKKINEITTLTIANNMTLPAILHQARQSRLEGKFCRSAAYLRQLDIKNNPFFSQESIEKLGTAFEMSMDYMSAEILYYNSAESLQALKATVPTLYIHLGLLCLYRRDLLQAIIYFETAEKHQAGYPLLLDQLYCVIEDYPSIQRHTNYRGMDCIGIDISHEIAAYIRRTANSLGMSWNGYLLREHAIFYFFKLQYFKKHDPKNQLLVYFHARFDHEYHWLQFQFPKQFPDFLKEITYLERKFDENTTTTTTTASAAQHTACPPTVRPSIFSVGCPTPTGTVCPSLPQLPMPPSNAQSLPTMLTRVNTSGPFPINVAPFTGDVIFPRSMR